MKLSAVSNLKYDNSNINNNKNTAQKNVNFKGATSALINFWQFIDNGGRALQFTAEDMTGTNIPRSAKGLAAGYKYTKKLNFLAFLQEALREFLTGPTMCVAPVLILNSAIKMTGKTANTHLENIRNLSYLMQESKLDPKDFEASFTTSVVEDMLKQTIGKPEIDSTDVKSLTEGILNYKNIKNKKESKQALAKLQTLFESIVKKSKSNYRDTNFLTAKYSIAKNETGATSFKNYVDYLNAFIQDYSKKFSKENTGVEISKDNIELFKNNWIAKRCATMASMIVITGLLMSVIPKIYTWASGSVNPNASTIYNEAKKEQEAK